MTEVDRRGVGDRRRGPRRVDDQDVPVPIPEPLEYFRARARWHRICAQDLMHDVEHGQPFYEQRRLDSAVALAEARGLDLAADELERGGA